MNIPNPEAQRNTFRAKMAPMFRESQNPPGEVEIGKRLRMFRKQAGLTQAQLGGRLGIAGPTISGYEKGTSRIVADELPKIARALGVHPSEFYLEPGQRLETFVSEGRSPFVQTFLAAYEQAVAHLPSHNRRAADMALALLDHELATAG